jgi:outer membrane protein assembly factor BamB
VKAAVYGLLTLVLASSFSVSAQYHVAIPVRSAELTKQLRIPSIQSQQANVPMLGGDPGRTGEMPGTGPSDLPEVKWEHRFSEGLMSTPAIVDGVAYIGTGWIGDLIETRPGTLDAIDIETGETIWSTPLPISSESSPAVADGMVYVADNAGTIYGVDAATGDIVWNRATDRTLVGAPVVAGGTVFVASGEAYDLNVAFADETVLLAAGLINDDGVEYVSTAVLIAFESKTGTEIWRASDFPEDVGVVDAYNASSGDRQWRHEVDWVTLNVSTDGESVFIGSGTPGIVSALELESGRELWTFNTNKVFWAGVTPSVSNGMVYVTSDHGAVFAIDAETGRQIWTAQVEDLWMFSQPLIAGDQLIVANRGGAIYALEISTGKERWQYDLRPTTSFSGRMVVVGGVLYAAQSSSSETDPNSRVGFLVALSGSK